MSVKLMSLVQDVKLPAAQKLLLLALCDQANDDGENIMPDLTKLVRVSGLSPRQVHIALGALQKRGHVTGARLAGSLSQYRVTPKPTIKPEPLL